MSLHAGVSTCRTECWFRASQRAPTDTGVAGNHADPSQDIAALAVLVNLSVSRLSHLFKLERAAGCAATWWIAGWSWLRASCKAAKRR